jgi:hypothetical protein
VLFLHLGTCSNAKQPLLQFQCPQAGLQCRWAQFDNIKVFYHPVSLAPQVVPGAVHAWAFYIARPGKSESECIKWYQEGIKISSVGPDGRWGECRALVVPPGARVRIAYPYGQHSRTHEIQFPSPGIETTVPTTVLSY